MAASQASQASQTANAALRVLIQGPNNDQLSFAPVPGFQLRETIALALNEALLTQTPPQWKVFWFEKPTKSAMKDDDAPGFRHAPDLFLTPWHWTAQEIVQFRSMAEDEQIVACKADNNNIIPPLAYLVMPISVTECVRQAEYSRGTARVYETNSTTTLFWHPADKMISFGTTGDMIAGAPHKREPNAERLRGNRHDFFKQRSAVVESLRCANPASLVSALTNTWNWLNNNYGLSPLPSIEQTFTTEWINWRASHP